MQLKYSKIKCSKITTIILLLGTLIISSACAHNRQICQDFVNYVNSELKECGKNEQLAFEDVCPKALDKTDTDCSGYYKCLRDTQRCENGIYYYEDPKCGTC